MSLDEIRMALVAAVAFLPAITILALALLVALVRKQGRPAKLLAWMLVALLSLLFLGVEAGLLGVLSVALR